MRSPVVVSLRAPYLSCYGKAVLWSATETSLSGGSWESSLEIFRARFTRLTITQLSKLQLLIVAPKYSFFVNHSMPLIDTFLFLSLFYLLLYACEKTREKGDERERRERKMREGREIKTREKMRRGRRRVVCNVFLNGSRHPTSYT